MTERLKVLVLNTSIHFNVYRGFESYCTRFFKKDNEVFFYKNFSDLKNSLS